MSNLLLLAGPAVEPVTLAEVKAHLRLDATEEDAVLGACIVAARQACESFTGLSLISQSWQLYLDAWPVRPIRLPRPPLQAVTAVKVFTNDNELTTLDPSLYEVDTRSWPGRLRSRAPFPWPLVTRPLAGIEITFRAGYGDSWNDVPQALRLGLLMTVAELYENREAAGFAASLPTPIAALWQPYRQVRL